MVVANGRASWPGLAQTLAPYPRPSSVVTMHKPDSGRDTASSGETRRIRSFRGRSHVMIGHKLGLCQGFREISHNLCPSQTAPAGAHAVWTNGETIIQVLMAGKH